MKLKIKRKTDSHFRILNNAKFQNNLLVWNGKYVFNIEKVKEAGFDRIYISSLSMAEAYANLDVRGCIIIYDDPDYDIRDIDIEKEQQENELRTGKKAVQIRKGIIGIEILTHLPRNLWMKIKDSATYYNEEDLEDFGYFSVEPGWYYSDGVISKLIDAGMKVKYGEININSVEDFRNEVTRRQKEARKTELALEAKKKKETELNEFLHNIFENAEKPSKDACKQISRLPEITFLKHEGPDIYGGGSWFHLDEKYFYFIENNGHDGDAWGLNNYPTGGAGAICHRVPLEDAKNYINTIEDYLGHSILPPQQRPGIDVLKEDLKKEIILNKELSFIDLNNAEVFPSDLDCIFLKYKNIFLGLSLDKKTAVIGAGGLYYNEKNDELYTRFANNFIAGNYYAAAAIPATSDFIIFFNTLLPDWTNKSANGRFKVAGYICSNTIDAISTAIGHQWPINLIDCRLDIELLSMSKDEWITVWSDNVVIPHILYTDGRKDIKTAVIDFFKLQVPLPATKNKVLDSTYLIEHTLHNGIKVFDLLQDYEISEELKRYGSNGIEVELDKIEMEDGTCYYSVYSVFVAPPDCVDEFYDLYAEREYAERKYKEKLFLQDN